MKIILMLEDEAQALNILQECLQAGGFDIVHTENGRVGIKQAKEKLHNLVICDTVTLELDSYDSTSMPSQGSVKAIVPFIFILPQDPKSKLEGTKIEADDYHTDSLATKEFMGALADQLEKRATLLHWCFSRSKQTLEPSVTDTLVNDVFHFIDTNYHRPITINDVAQAVGYSPAYLTNVIGNQTGNTIHWWLINRRMTEAQHLLLETEQTVNQIAQAVGYQDACYFSRQFRKLYSMPPKEWKKCYCMNK